MQQQISSEITFKTEIVQIGTWVIARLPEAASAQLPSKGQVMITGTYNHVDFQTPLEPDGNFRHWFRIDATLLKLTNTSVGDTVTIKMNVLKNWPDPELPHDLRKAIAQSPKASELWQHITPMARWEWLRWTRSTSNIETHKRRIEVAISKLEAGKRRPCCWNRNLCTVPEVSKNGVLLEPART